MKNREGGRGETQGKSCHRKMRRVIKYFGLVRRPIVANNTTNEAKPLDNGITKPLSFH